MLQLILAVVALSGASPETPARAAGPFLSAEYRVVQAGTDRPATSLEPGKKLDVLVTVRADQGKGVKINKEFKSHFLRLEVIEVDEKGNRKGSLSKDEFTVEPKSPRIDPATGTGRLTVGLAETVDPRNLRLNVVAEIVLCDTDDTWCSQIREELMFTLPAGRVDMKTLPLKYHARDTARVVLKKGHKAPEFTATSSDGKPVRLSDFRGKKNVVLVFGRGFW